MISTTSSNKLGKELKSTFQWSIKKRFSLLALFGGLMFIGMPLVLILSLGNARSYNQQNPITANNLYQIDLNDTFSQVLLSCSSFVIMPLALLFVLILSVILFNYMHQKRSTDLFHSIPISRAAMLLGRYFAGAASLGSCLLLNYAVCAIIFAVFGLDPAAGGLILLTKLLFLTFFMAMAAFTFCVVMAVCSGTTFDAVISIVVICITYPLMMVLGDALAQMILPGYNGSFSYTITTAFSPFAAAFLPFIYLSTSQTTPLSFFLWWGGFTLAMLLGAVWLYNRRKSESAESNFAFPIPKNIIRFVATGAAALSCGFIFRWALNEGDFSFFIGVLVGSLATHMIAEAIYGRGFKRLKTSFTYYGVFLVAFAAFYGVLVTGAFGYDTRIPQPDQVASVDAQLSGYSYSSPYPYDFNYSGFNVWSSEKQGELLATVNRELTDPETIAKIVSYHQDLAGFIRQTQFPYGLESGRGSGNQITYHLITGKTITRSYPSAHTYVAGASDFADQLETEHFSILNSKEYKTSGNPLYYLEPEFIDSIAIYDGKNDGSIVSPNHVIIEELLTAMRADWEACQLEPYKDPYLVPAAAEAVETAFIADTKAESEEDDWYLSVELHTKEASLPEDARLKKVLGDYNGNVYMNSQSYSIPREFTNTLKVIEKNGWIKESAS